MNSTEEYMAVIGQLGPSFETALKVQMAHFRSLLIATENSGNHICESD